MARTHQGTEKIQVSDGTGFSRSGVCPGGKNPVHLGRTQKLKVTIAVMFSALLFGALACSNSKQPASNVNRPAPAPAPPPSKPPISPVDAAVIEKASPFNHNRAEHKKLECASCHQRTDNEPTPRFPSHSSCNDCHQRDFSAATSQLCAGCHKMPVAAQPELIGFPARLKQLGLKSFSHRQHLSGIL